MKPTKALFLLLLVPMISIAAGEERSRMDWKKKMDLFSEQYFKFVPFFGVFSKTVFNTVKIQDGTLKNSHWKIPRIHEDHFIRI